MMLWVIVLNKICYWLMMFWFWSGVVCIFSDLKIFSSAKLRSAATWYISELKPFYFVALGGYYITLALQEDFGFGIYFSFLLDVYLYFVIKKFGDDDRWERRLQKLKEKVSVSEGKLVVVPS